MIPERAGRGRAAGCSDGAPSVSRGWGLPVALALVLLPAVASAGAGWYLLAPSVAPIERTPSTGTLPGPITWRYDADLRTWNQEGAFDSARDCEAEKSRRHDLASQEQFRRRLEARTGKAAQDRAQNRAIDAALTGRPAPKMTPEMEQAELTAVRAEVLWADTDAMAWSLAVCIASDDRRLR